MRVVVASPTLVRRFLAVACCFAPTARSFSIFPSRQLSSNLQGPVSLSRTFRPTQESFPISTCSMSTTASSSEDELSLWGGDFAGYVGKFAPSDGALIPLPVYLVPADMIEWGQEPSCLEILVSEEMQGTSSGSIENAILERQTITVLPAIGCGVDNLETQKSKEIFPEESTVLWQDSQHPSVKALDVVTQSIEGGDEETHRLETIFALPDSHRVRVSIDFNFKVISSKDSYEIQSPVRVQLERRTSSTSTKGSLADGGGLDGRTVSTLIGDTLKPQLSFAQQKPATQGKWKSADSLSQVVHLPGDITIATGPGDNQSWILEVSHFTSSNNSDNALEGSKRALQRVYQGSEPCTTKFSEETSEYVA